MNLILRHPSLWLVLYGAGAVATTGAVGAALGGAAAGTVAGLLTLAGTVIYESLRARHEDRQIASRVSKIDQKHDVLARDIASTRSDVERLRDDMAITNRSLQQQARKLEDTLNPPRRVAPVQGRTAAQARPRNFEDLHVMAASRLANMNPAPVNRSRQASTDTIEAAMPAPKFSEPVIAELLHHAVEHDRIEIFAQPVVRLPSRRLACIELFARIRARAGVYLAAEQYRHLAEEESLLSEVDHRLLRHALDSVRANARRDTEMTYILNISSTTLRNAGFMSDLLAFLRTSRDLAPQLVFELRAADFMAMGDPFLAVLKGLTKAGCGFSIDNVESLEQISMDRFAGIRLRFLKIEAKRLMQINAMPSGEARIEAFQKRLGALGVSLVVERLESERELREILDFEIDYGEGFLFGKPDLEIAYRPRKTA